MGFLPGKKKKDDSEDLSDEELAQLVKDRVEAGSAIGKTMREAATPDEMKAAANAEAGKAYGQRMVKAATEEDPVKKDEPSGVGGGFLETVRKGIADVTKGAAPDDNKEAARKVIERVAQERGVDPELAAQRRSSSSLDDMFFPGKKPPAKSVKVTAGDPTIVAAREPTIINRVPEDNKQSAEAVIAKAENRPYSFDKKQEANDAARQKVEGSVYLQNTDAQGEKSRGVEVRRGQFRTDEDFDKFVQHQRDEGNVWDEPAPEAKKSGGSGILSNVAKLFTGASGAKGGDAYGKKMVAAAGGKDQQAVTGESTKGGTSEPGYDSAARARSFANNPPPTSYGPFKQEVPQHDPMLRNNPLLTHTPAEVVRSAPELIGANVGEIARSQPADYDAAMAPDSAQPFAGATPGQAAQLPPGVPAPPPQAGAPSRSMPTGGNVPPMPVQPTYDAQEQDAVTRRKEAYMEAAAAVKDQGDAQAKVYADDAARATSQAKKTQDRMDYIQAGQKQAADSMREAISTLQNPAKTPDPDRYWKNHSRLMFAIGVGLLAQAGKDINGVLSNTNTAIERDVEQQKQEFENPRKEAKEKLAGAQTMYGMYRDQGHDAFESQKMAEITGAEILKTNIAKIAANTTSATAQANAQQMAAQVDQANAQRMNDLSVHREQRDAVTFDSLEKARHSRVEEGLDFQKEGDRRAGAAGTIKPAEKKRLDQSDELLNAVNEYEALLGPKEGMMSGLATSASANVPLLNTDAKDQRKALENARVRLSIAVGKNPRQNKMEMQKLLDSLPLNGSTNQRRLVLDSLRKAANDERESALSGRPAEAARTTEQKPQRFGILNGKRVPLTD